MHCECVMCVCVCVTVSLRNVCELLEFADMYNATQLKTTCQQFITVNLPALLESRLLIQYCVSRLPVCLKICLVWVPGLSLSW